MRGVVLALLAHPMLGYGMWGSGDTRCPWGLCPPLFLQPRVPLCWVMAAASQSLPEQSSPAGTGVCTSPGTPCMSPQPWCHPGLSAYPHDPTVHPHSPLPCPPPAPPCISPCPLHVPTAPCLSLPQPCGTGMWGGGRTRRHPGGQVAPKGLGSTQIWGSFHSPSPSPGLWIFLHAPTSAQGADWQGGHPWCFGAGSPSCSWA